MFLKEKSILEIKKADVIFGCTDNLSSRSLLNDISLQYHIPLIDIGCRITVTENNSIRDIVAKIQIVSPENACLWCTNTLDGRQILLEKLDDKEKDKMIKDGYYQPIERQPSIIGLTTLAASLGVNKLLSLLGIYGEEYSSMTQIDLRNEFMINNSPAIKTSCVCINQRGQGDLRQIV